MKRLPISPCWRSLFGRPNSVDMGILCHLCWQQRTAYRFVQATVILWLANYQITQNLDDIHVSILEGHSKRDVVQAIARAGRVVTVKTSWTSMPSNIQHHCSPRWRMVARTTVQPAEGVLQNAGKCLRRSLVSIHADTCAILISNHVAKGIW